MKYRMIDKAAPKRNPREYDRGIHIAELMLRKKRRSVDRLRRFPAKTVRRKLRQIIESGYIKARDRYGKAIDKSRKNPGQSPWQWGIHVWHKPQDGVSAMHHPTWRRLIHWINGGSKDDQHIDIQVHTDRTMHINGVFKHKARAADFVQHIEALPGATKISYENRER